MGARIMPRLVPHVDEALNAEYRITHAATIQSTLKIMYIGILFCNLLGLEGSVVCEYFKIKEISPSQELYV